MTTEPKWRITMDNDIGPNDDGYWEWWTVTDGKMKFDCNSEQDAKWLCDKLNSKA